MDTLAAVPYRVQTIARLGIVRYDGTSFCDISSFK